MILSKIKIENFRSIRNQTLELKDFSLLVGANDHGKSNIMKAIEAVFNLKLSENGEMLQDSFYRANKRRESGSSPMRISVLIDSLPSGLLHTKRKLKQVAITVQFMSDNKVKISFNRGALDKASNKHDKKAHEKFREIQKHFNVRYIPTFRNIEAELDPFSENSILFNMLSEYLYASTQRLHGGKTFEYRQMKKLKSEFDDLLRESFKDVRDSAKKYLPSSYSDGSFIFSILGEISEEKRDKLLTDIISRNTKIINQATGSNVTELGSGIQQAITLGLVEKTCIIKNKTNILLLEEPETFLHPNAQRELFVKLSNISKRPATQIVFSTHSSAILDATELSKIVVVRKTIDSDIKEKTTKILQIPNNLSIQGKKIVNEVELKKTFENSDVFFSELVIFVEGFSDELVLKEVIKTLSPELLYRVSIINCQGNSKLLSTT